MIEDSSSGMEWAVVLIYGFRDSPISWCAGNDKMTMHSRNETGCGENDYAIVLTRGASKLVFKIDVR